MRRAVVLGVVAGVVLAAVTGCSGAKITPAEDSYLDAQYLTAKSLEFQWTGPVQDAALKLGHSICTSWTKGVTRDELKESVAKAGDKRVSEFNDAAVDNALRFLCPSKE